MASPPCLIAFVPTAVLSLPPGLPPLLLLVKLASDIVPTAVLLLPGSPYKSELAPTIVFADPELGVPIRIEFTCILSVKTLPPEIVWFPLVIIPPLLASAGDRFSTPDSMLPPFTLEVPLIAPTDNVPASTKELIAVFKVVGVT